MRSAIMNRKKTMKLSKYLIVGIILAAAAIIMPSHSRNRYKADEPEGINIQAENFSDGTYTGTATGYQPGIEVEIEIVGGVLQSVEVIEHSEIGRQFWTRPINLIPDVIVDKQQTDVDVVGGATSTSHGIMAAVEDALSKAI